MITVYVKHYLNKDGKQFFHSTWFPEVQTQISKQEGFISINSADDQGDYHCINITLQFQNDDTLQAWAQTAKHDELVDLLDPYRICDWKVARLGKDDSVLPHQLVWQKVVPRNVHYNTLNQTQTESIQRTANYIQKEFSQEYSGHDWWHIYRVWKISKHIAEREGADLFTTQLIALLHDLEDWKLSESHQELKKTRKWLKSLHLSEEIINKICNIIHKISFKGAKVADEDMPLEGKIAQDADRLDAIGAIGIARTFAYGGVKSRLMFDPRAKPTMHQSFEEYKNNKGTTINHFYEKMLLLKDRMNTKTAQKMAEEKHALMLSYLDNFYKEWYCEIPDV